MDVIHVDLSSGAATLEWLRAFNEQEARRRQEEALAAELTHAAEQVRQKIEEEK